MKKRSPGFTLIELLITLVIASLLLTIAVPTFRDILQDYRLTVQTNRFISAVNFARSEAVKRRQNVLLTATDDSDSTDEWGEGWEITADGTTVQSMDTLEGTATLNSTNNYGTFTFYPSGRVDHGDTLNLCDDRTGETGRALVLSLSGRVSVSDTTCS